MSNNNGNAMAAWVDEVNGIAALVSRPMEGMSDPRYIALVEKHDAETVARFAADMTAAQMGENYFTVYGGDLIPLPPIELPTWAKSHHTSLDDYPNTLTVEFEGAKWDAGEYPEVWARMVQTFTIALRDFEDSEDRSGTTDTWAAGDVRPEPVVVEVSYLEDNAPGHESTRRQEAMNVDSARALEVALGRALRALD